MRGSDRVKNSEMIRSPRRYWRPARETPPWPSRPGYAHGLRARDLRGRRAGKSGQPGPLSRRDHQSEDVQRAEPFLSPPQRRRRDHSELRRFGSIVRLADIVLFADVQHAGFNRLFGDLQQGRRRRSRVEPVLRNRLEAVLADRETRWSQHWSDRHERRVAAVAGAAGQVVPPAILHALPEDACSKLGTFKSKTII